MDVHPTILKFCNQVTEEFWAPTWRRLRCQAWRLQWLGDLWKFLLSCSWWHTGMIAHKKKNVRINLQDSTVYGSKFSQEPVAFRTGYMGILSPSKVCAISRRSEPFLFKIHLWIYWSILFGWCACACIYRKAEVLSGWWERLLTRCMSTKSGSRAMRAEMLAERTKNATTALGAIFE